MWCHNVTQSIRQTDPYASKQVTLWGLTGSVSCDALTYRGIASEAVFTVPPVVGAFKQTFYPH